MDHRTTISSMLLLVLVSASAVAGCSCKFKYHSYKAEQIDSKGRRCWDNVTFQCCGGCCQSYQTGHWQFPYIETHHTVCIHAERRHKSVRLRFCDPGAEPGTDTYHYVDAASCKCMKCSSENTSCEWIPPSATHLSGLVFKDRRELTNDEMQRLVSVPDPDYAN